VTLPLGETPRISADHAFSAIEAVAGDRGTDAQGLGF
jgi:hypothetical protein